MAINPTKVIFFSSVSGNINKKHLLTAPLPYVRDTWLTKKILSPPLRDEASKLTSQGLVGAPPNHVYVTQDRGLSE